MSFWSRIFGSSRTEEPAAPEARVTEPTGLRAIAGGRVSLDTADSFFSTPRAVLPPPDAESHWRFAGLDSHTLERIRPAQLLELLADLSPDISRALWDTLRLMNPGHTVKVYRPGTEDEDARGQAVIDALFARLRELYGSVDVVIARLNLGAFMRGALMGEVIFDERGREVVDIATPDPSTARFHPANDSVRGTIWQLGQMQGIKGFVPLDPVKVQYIPIDPMPGKPYGRAPAWPALFSTLFLLGLMHDLRRVIAQQGYPRLDLTVNLTALAASLPQVVKSDPEKYRAWVNATIKEVQDAYSGLKPDDAYVHTDVVEVNRPVGTVDSDSLGAIDGLIDALERMSVRALKSMPLMFGITDGVSEANANRQWEIHAAGIKALQHLCESFFERFLSLALQAQGIQARVEMRFAELRAAEMFRDAQTERMQIANARDKYNAGWWSQDEAANEIVGHDADAPEPRGEGDAGGSLTGIDAENPEPGSARSQENGHGRGEPGVLWRTVVK